MLTIHLDPVRVKTLSSLNKRKVLSILKGLYLLVGSYFWLTWNKYQTSKEPKLTFASLRLRQELIFFFFTAAGRAFCQGVNISNCCLLFLRGKVLVPSVWVCSLTSLKSHKWLLRKAALIPPLWDVRFDSSLSKVVIRVKNDPLGALTAQCLGREGDELFQALCTLQHPEVSGELCCLESSACSMGALTTT